MKQQNTQPEMERQAVKVSLVSILGNLLLTIGKLLAGIIAHSGAMISDAVHSASDIFSSIIVIIGVKLAGKASDEHHPYGHERFECVAAIVLAVILLITGLFIGIGAVEQIMSPGNGTTAIPGMLALAAAAVSIAAKEWMYWYTRYYARKLDSGALMADAWHHRSDALSSVGALLGIVAARKGFPVFEPIASLAICLLIGKAAYDIFKDAISKMVDHSCSCELEDQLRRCAGQQENVLGVDRIRTRVFGNRVYADIDIRADGTLTLSQGHTIAQQVHDAVEKEFPNVKHIMVHVNPD